MPDTTNKMTTQQVEAAYRGEHPEWTDDEIRRAAWYLHRELDSMDRKWRRQQKRFYSHESPAGLRPGEPITDD